MSILNEQTWLDKFDMPVLIAGPCSAESEEQVMETADGMDFSRVNVFRAGIWKPRTKPGSFEGIGEIGLKWLTKVREKHGVLISTEIANKDHAKAALDHDLDILWLGARTTVNPFAVQEIAEAIAGTDKIVLVKNPVNPDLALWIGGLERLAAQGIKNLGVIHRGFSSYNKTKYRNKPNWQIPLELKKQFPNLPVITDPSHICGNRTGLYDVSQQAFNLNFDGLMLETHRDPDNAWSDAAQQVTPDGLKEIIQKIDLRQQKGEDSLYTSKLATFREDIDELDSEIMSVLAKRMEVASKIGEIKAENNVAVFQPGRWTEIFEKVKTDAVKLGLGEDFIEAFYKAIHQESINKQNAIMLKHKKAQKA